MAIPKRKGLHFMESFLHLDVLFPNFLIGYLFFGQIFPDHVSFPVLNLQSQVLVVNQDAKTRLYILHLH